MKNIKTNKVINNPVKNDSYYIQTYGMTESEVLNAIKGLQGKERSEELRFMMLAHNMSFNK